MEGKITIMHSTDYIRAVNVQPDNNCRLVSYIEKKGITHFIFVIKIYNQLLPVKI